MPARRHATSILTLFTAVSLAACGSDGPSGPSGRSLAERIAVAQTFFDKAGTYSLMGAEGAAITLQNAGLAILLGAPTGTFTVSSNGVAALSIPGGAPLTATTAGSYEGLVMRTRVVDIDLDETTNILLGWRGGDSPTDLVFAQDFDGFASAAIFVAPNAQWTPLTLSVAFPALSTTRDCDIPAALRNEIESGSDFTCRVGTATASFDIPSSMPSPYDANTAEGNRTASASVVGFPAVSITYDYSNAR